MTEEQIKKALEKEIRELEKKLKFCELKENFHIVDKKILDERMYEGMEAAYRDALKDLKQLYKKFFD